MNQNYNPHTYQDCIETLEYAMNEIILGIGQLNPICQDLIIVINPSGESVNLNHLRGEDPDKYFVNLNRTAQIYNPPFVKDVKTDLIRHYHFKHLARKCPQVRIQIAFLIPSKQIQNLQKILDYDFLKISKPNGLIIFFYDSPDDDYQNDSQTLKQLFIDQNDDQNVVCSFIKEQDNENRIIFLTKQEIQVTRKKTSFKQGLSEIFQLAINDEIQIVLSDIIEFCSQQSNVRLQNLLPKLKEFEITLRYLGIGRDQKDKLIQAIDDIYSFIGAQKPNVSFDKFEKYIVIFELFRVEVIGNLLQITFQDYNFTQVLNRKQYEPIQQIQQLNQPQNQQQQQKYSQQNYSIQQIEKQTQLYPFQTQQQQYQSNSPLQHPQPLFKKPQIFIKSVQQFEQPQQPQQPQQQTTYQQYDFQKQKYQTQGLQKPIQQHELNLEQQYESIPQVQKKAPLQNFQTQPPQYQRIEMQQQYNQQQVLKAFKDCQSSIKSLEQTIQERILQEKHKQQYQQVEFQEQEISVDVQTLKELLQNLFNFREYLERKQINL